MGWAGFIIRLIIDLADLQTSSVVLPPNTPPLPPQVCMETYGTAPDVIVSGDSAVSIPYIPAHLDYMLYELLKNAMRCAEEGVGGWGAEGLRQVCHP